MRLASFDTPLFAAVVGANLCEEIAARLITEAARVDGLDASIVGGWHGPPDIRARSDACWRALCDVVIGAVRDSVADVASRLGRPLGPYDCPAHGWGVVLANGGYSTPHDHRQAHWSAVWYADPGDPAPSELSHAGRLCFMDPRGSVVGDDPFDLFPTRVSVEATPGLLVVFPGWLTHFVSPYRGARPRVSVAFNVCLERAR